jgi:hypothetical protein
MLSLEFPQFEIFGERFIPLPVTDQARGQAHDLATLVTLAWRHNVDQAATEQALALKASAQSYLDDLFEAMRLGVSDADVLTRARGGALAVLREGCPALAEVHAAGDPQVARMLGFVNAAVVEESAHLLTAAAALEKLKRERLRGHSRVRARLDVHALLVNSLTAIAELRDERTEREVQFAFFRSLWREILVVLNQVEALIEGRRADIKLPSDAILSLQGVYASVDALNRRGHELSGFGMSLFGEDGRELKVDEDLVVDAGLREGMDAWRCNHKIQLKDGSTSKVHTLGGVVSAAERFGRDIGQYLSQSLTSALMTPIKIGEELEFQPIDAIRGDWILPFAELYAVRVGPSGLPGLKELQQRVQKRLAIALERQILQLGAHSTLQQSLVKVRDPGGFYGLRDVEFEEDRKGAYAFAGGRATFTVGHDESVAGVTPCEADLAIWNLEGQLLGLVSARYMRGGKGVRWNKLDRDQYIFIADACDDVWTSMAQALCDELGGPPDRPVVIISDIERHPTRTTKGFGVVMVKEILRQLQSKHAYLRAIAVHVAPAQFHWEDGEAAPAAIELERFNAAHKLKAWVDGPLAAGVADMGVDVIATMSKRAIGHDVALGILGQEHLQRLLDQASRGLQP